MNNNWLLSEILGGGIADWNYVEETIVDLGIENEFVNTVRDYFQYDYLTNNFDPVYCLYQTVLEYVTNNLNLSYNILNHIHIYSNYLDTQYDIDEDTAIKLKKLCNRYLEENSDVVIEWFSEKLHY